MAKYGSVVYGQTTYGQKSRLSFSVSPFTATAVDYEKVELNWGIPVGGYSAFRVLRNQDGFPETSEDGVILFEEFNINLDDEGSEITTGTVSIGSLVDEPLLPVPKLVPGKFAYYRVWILKTSDNVWYPAGDTYVLVPSDHPLYGPDRQILRTTHDKVMRLIPRVFTSTAKSTLDEVDNNTDLYVFLKGFSFTLDEFLTMIDTLIPNYLEERTSPQLLGKKAEQLGLNRDSIADIKHQKKMVREALYIFSQKGTLSSLSTLVESLTGYQPSISVSHNLMLTPQDSTFYKGLGNWRAEGNCNLTLEDVEPVTNEVLSIDNMYSAKVVVTGTANTRIVNGEEAPITRGVPVSQNLEYTYSLYAKTVTGTVSGTLTINWHTSSGALISSSSSSEVFTSTWDEYSVTAISPAGATYATIAVSFSSTGTVFFDMVQVAESSNTDYSEARAVTVFLGPKKTNCIHNPSFENAGTSWTIVSGAESFVTVTPPNNVLVGNTAIEFEPGSIELYSDSSFSSLPSGQYCTFSIHGNTTEESESVTLSLSAVTFEQVTNYSILSNVLTIEVRQGHPFNAGDTVIVSDIGPTINGTYTLTGVTPYSVSMSKTAADAEVSLASVGTITKLIETSKQVTIQNSWTRVQANLYIPPLFSPENTFVRVTVSGEFAGTVQFDAAQLESSYLATDYFDGSYGTERDALWDGTVNNSKSYIYPNKIVNVARVVEELPSYLPFNTPWIISSESGTESSGIS